MPQKLQDAHRSYPEVLHATRSLLCTATNETPHDCFFSFPCRAAAGPSLPIWSLSPGPWFLRSYVRNRKTDPLVEPVELLQANPTYVHIQFPDGCESTVSIWDLSPALPDRCTTTSHRGHSANTGDHRTTYITTSSSLRLKSPARDASMQPLI